MGLEGAARLPDETTSPCVGKTPSSRHLLKRHAVAMQASAAIHAGLAQKGLRLKAGIEVDASIISVPNWTKSKMGQRDPEMPPTQRATRGTMAHRCTRAWTLVPRWTD